MQTANNETTSLFLFLKERKNRRFVVFLCLLIIITVLAGIFKPKISFKPLSLQSNPVGIMGTDCSIGLVISRYSSTRQIEQANAGLQSVEANLRRRESVTFSNWVENSEVSRYNQSAMQGQNSPASAELQTVLDAAQTAKILTDGAFDVYCRPQIELWKSAQKSGIMPTAQQIQTAQNERLAVDLGGISKGFCIDRAIEELIALKPIGAMVDIGGDVAVWGRSIQVSYWTFVIANPFVPPQKKDAHSFVAPSSIWGKFQLDATAGTKAVCTSGGYYRGFQMGNQRFSHIINPNTGFPLQSTPDTPVSVTVLANDCMTADIWATALSVLGKEGLNKLPADVEAYMIIGQPSNYSVVQTPKFPSVQRLHNVSVQVRK